MADFINGIDPERTWPMKYGPGDERRTENFSAREVVAGGGYVQ